MFVESDAYFEKNLLLLSHASKEHQATEYAWSHNLSCCDLSSNSSDQQNQVAVVQALMDLNACTHIPYCSVDTSSHQNHVFEASQKLERKTCNCTKSHCLKLYCECFAKGQCCDGCNCSNCMNNFKFENDRKKAIKTILERNPLAFYPKIGSSVRKHSKGCNCKRSNCLKNYCECYEAKISCSDLCKCRGCRNFIKPANPNGIQSVGPEHFSQFCEKFFTACITSEVIEVACSCMLSQLLLATHHNMSDTDQEHVVLAEFAKCLDYILDSVNKLRDARFSVRNYGQNVSTLSPSVIPQMTKKSVSCFCPSYPLASIPCTTLAEISMSLPYSAGNMPGTTRGIATCQGAVSTDQTYFDYKNFLVSSEMSEVLLPQYDLNYPSFHMVLSPGAGDASNMMEISNLTKTNSPTILIPYSMFPSSLSEPRSHHSPASPIPPPQQQPLAYPMGSQSFLMSSSTATVSSEDTICYPLTYSTEADLAAAAISAEVDPPLAPGNADFYDYNNAIDENSGCDCAGDSDECFHPDALDLAYCPISTPFDLLPTKF